MNALASLSNPRKNAVSYLDDGYYYYGFRRSPQYGVSVTAVYRRTVHDITRRSHPVTCTKIFRSVVVRS